jgi:beta-N-acetylhexosaminidase
MNNKFNLCVMFMVLLICFVFGCTQRTQLVNVLDDTAINEADPIGEIIDKMTLRQKISGLIVVGIEETSVNERVRQRWSEYPFGGVILFERNIIREDWLRELTGDLQSLSSPEYPLIICIDEEGGAITRLPGESFPAAADMAKMSRNEVFMVGQAVGKKLKEYGVTMNLAPVLDVNIDPRNTVIGNRSFSSDPEIVSSFGMAFYQGMADSGVTAVGKHYPGHGSTLVDSHVALPVLDKNVEELYKLELIPFVRAVEANIPVIMTAHLLVSGVDDKPATMSKKLIDILRNDIGFDGVIISDDLEMGALTENYSWPEIVIGTFSAGVDLLLISHSPELQAEAVHILEEAYKEGKISDEHLNSSLRRVLEIKSGKSKLLQ